VLCCAVLCCAVLCCAALCCAVLCCAVLCCPGRTVSVGVVGNEMSVCVCVHIRSGAIGCVCGAVLSRRPRAPRCPFGIDGVRVSTAILTEDERAKYEASLATKEKSDTKRSRTAKAALLDLTEDTVTVLTSKQCIERSFSCCTRAHTRAPA
jgi:hypothetical protein